MMRAIVEQQVIIAKIKLELSSEFFFKNFKINKLASLLIPYCCFFVSLCLSICIIVSSLCKKKNTLEFFIAFSPHFYVSFYFTILQFSQYFWMLTKKKFLLCTSLASMLFFCSILNWIIVFSLNLFYAFSNKQKNSFFVFCCS